MGHIRRIFASRAADARSVRSSVVVSIDEGRIAGIEETPARAAPGPADIDLRDGGLLLPGFIDIHVHGGAGRNVMEGTGDALSAIARHLGRHGVTGFLATTVTAPWPEQARALATAAAALESADNGSEGAAVLGCHLEGPYINPAKKGAQPLQHIRPPSVAELQGECGAHIGAVRVVTLAPEMPGALELIRFLTKSGIVASIGHTMATYAEVAAAIDAGARHITHCYNAMRQLDSREPGVVGAALCRPELQAELIWDNIHVHEASCRSLIRAKGMEGVILISDGIPGAGMHEGYTFSLGDMLIRVEDGAARLPDGTLAGSLLTLDRAFANASSFSLSECAAMSSHNAARALGLGHRKGLLSPGYDADLTAVDPSGRVIATVVAGRVVYRD